MEYQTEVGHALPSDMIQQRIPRDRKGHGKESQEEAEDDEGRERVHGDGSSFSMTREMLHYLAGVDECVAGGNDRDNLANMHKVRESYSTGT